MQIFVRVLPRRGVYWQSGGKNNVIFNAFSRYIVRTFMNEIKLTTEILSIDFGLCRYTFYADNLDGF